MSKKIAELREAVKVYPRGKEKVFALNGVNLTIEEKDFLAIVGPSGSGKTTLLNILGCIDRLTSGQFSFKGKDLTHAPEATLIRMRQESIGFVFQHFFLISTLTALENTLLPGIFTRNERKKEKGKELLTLLGLGDKMNARISELSGGEMQRVAFARALLNSPSLLLADEPTGNLDSKTALTIFNLLKELNEKGLTIVVVTHNLSLANSAKRVVRLEDGRIL